MKYRNRRHWFLEQLKKYDRIAVVGGPRVGKTTLCRICGDRDVVHGDDFKHLGWSEASAAIAKDCNARKGKFVVEGTAVVRALRKGLKVDAVLFLVEPLTELSDGQKAMSKGVITVASDWFKNNKHTPVIQAPPPNEAETDLEASE